MSESSFVMEDNWRQRKSLMLIRKRAYWENCVSPAQMLLGRLFKPPGQVVNLICLNTTLTGLFLYARHFSVSKQHNNLVLFHKNTSTNKKNFECSITKNSATNEKPGLQSRNFGKTTEQRRSGGGEGGEKIKVFP